MSDPPSQTDPSKAGLARWARWVLFPLPTSTIAFVAGLVLAAIAVFFGLFAYSTDDSFGWLVSALAISLSSLIFVANWQRYRVRSTCNSFESDRPNAAPDRPTYPIIVLLIAVYSWMMTLGLQLFRLLQANGAMNQNRGLKYQVTVILTIVVTLYLASHGKKVIEPFGGLAGGRGLKLTPRQAVWVTLVTILAGFYMAWLISDF